MGKLLIPGAVRCLALVLLSVVLLGCGRGFREYQLNEKSFGPDTLKEIETTAGIHLPAGVKGLKFHYFPPIDPIFFAKIEVPAHEKAAMIAEISRFTDTPQFPDDFAHGICTWWPATFPSALISRKAALGDYFLELYLVEEQSQLILYVKYFTI